MQEGVQFTIIPDNAAASLMMQQKVDMVIVGADRIARNGDVANKSEPWAEPFWHKLSESRFMLQRPPQLLT